MRFLAGICRHDDYHDHPVYQELVQQLVPTIQNSSRSGLQLFPTIQNSSRSLQLVRCAYECPSIMDYTKNIRTDNLVEVQPVVGLDWYATGYCISHFSHKWSLDLTFLEKENISLLIKGLKSSMASGPLSVQIDTVVLSRLRIDHNDDEEVILQQLIGMIQLRSLVCYGFECTSTFISLVFQHPSIQSLDLRLFGLDIDTELQLPHCNTSLLNLTTYSFDLCQLAKLILDCTSLNYLEITEISYESALPVLINIVQSHPSLEILKIGDGIECNYRLSRKLFDLIKAAARNSRLKSLILTQYAYNKLPSHLKKPPVVPLQDTFS